MKPTRGRVSPAPFDAPWLGLSTFGALARSVKDSALLLDVLQGSTASEASQVPPPASSFAEAVAAQPDRLRVAISRKIPPGLIAKISEDQRQAWDRTARLLRELGHEVFERDPAYGLASLEFTQTWLRGIHEDFSRLSRPELTERTTRQMAAAGRVLVPPRRRAAILARRPRTTTRILELWNDADVLLTPGLATTAIEAEGGFGRPAPMAFDRAARFTPWTPIFNLTGQPALTLPAGFGTDEMPLSVQLVGRPGAEAALYSIAAEIEAAQPWAQARPAL
jgi:amidase